MTGFRCERVSGKRRTLECQIFVKFRRIYEGFQRVRELRVNVDALPSTPAIVVFFDTPFTKPFLGWGRVGKKGGGGANKL